MSFTDHREARVIALRSSLARHIELAASSATDEIFRAHVAAGSNIQRILRELGAPTRVDLPARAAKAEQQQ
jgi:hypothetical protein